MYDVLILGAGPAGLSAAIYTSRYELRAVVIGKSFGMASETSDIENYIGIYPVKGIELILKFREHAKKFGAEIFDEEAVSIEKKGGIFIAKTKTRQFEGKSVIFAMGGTKRKIGLVEEEKFIGKGISYCATCDGLFFRDKIVAVLGGANSAITTATIMSDLAKKVYLIHKGNKFEAAPGLIDKLKKKENVEFISNSAVKKIEGNTFVSSVTIDRKGKKQKIAVEGVFVEFGYTPNSGLAKKLGVETEDNRIAVKDDMSTNAKGFFAAGDVTTGSNKFDQIITAAAEGAIAAHSAYKFLRGV